HAARHLTPRKHPLRTRGPQRPDAPVVHGAEAHGAPIEAVAFDGAGEALALGDAHHVHVFPGPEHIGPNLLADLQTGEVLPVAHPHFLQVAGRLNARRPEVALLRLVEALFLDLAKAQLQRGVAVPFGGALLDNDTRPGLDDGHRHRVPGFIKDLRHANLSAENALGHSVAPPLPGLAPQAGVAPDPAYSLIS